MKLGLQKKDGGRAANTKESAAREGDDTEHGGEAKGRRNKQQQIAERSHHPQPLERIAQPL